MTDTDYLSLPPDLSREERTQILAHRALAEIREAGEHARRQIGALTRKRNGNAYRAPTRG